MAHVNVSVNRRVYRMACEDGEEEHVVALGARFDSAIAELRAALGEVGDQRLMAMAGILITDRLDDAERRLADAERELRELRESRRNALARFEGAEESFVESLEDAAARIEHLAQRIHAVSGPPDDIGG